MQLFRYDAQGRQVQLLTPEDTARIAAVDDASSSQPLRGSQTLSELGYAPGDRRNAYAAGTT